MNLQNEHVQANPVNDPMRLIEKKLYPLLYGHLPMQAKARLAHSCRFFRNGLQAELIEQRERFFAVFSEELLLANIFDEHPLPFDWLLQLMNQNEGVLTEFFARLDDGRWQLAALCGMEKAVIELLGEQTATTVDSHLCTVVHFFALGGHIELVKKYLPKPSEFDPTRDDPKHTIPKFALAGNHAELARVLLEQYHYDPRYVNTNDQKSLLHFAVDGGGLECVQLLLEQLNKKVTPLNTEETTNLATYAFSAGHLAIYDYFQKQLDKDLLATPEAQYEYIINAVKNGMLKKALAVINQYQLDPQKISAHNLNLLTAAAQGGQFLCAQYFIEQEWFRSDATFTGGTNILHHAALTGKVHFIDLAVEHFELNPCATIDNRFTVLHFLAQHGNWRTFHYIQQRYFPDWQETIDDKFQLNMVHFAATRGHLNFIKQFVDHFGDNCLQHRDNRQRSVLFKACQSNSEELIIWLVSNGHFSASEFQELCADNQWDFSANESITKWINEAKPNENRY